MKNVNLFLFGTLLTVNVCIGQIPKGEVVVHKLYSELLENPGGEDPARRLTIYLPPGYETSEQRYPVIYYLHGFTWSDSLMISVDKFDELLDKAIALKKIKPVIVVMPDQHTLFRGSWYTNSKLTGKWADFTGTDLVRYIDKNFRTIADRDSRGIAGHSMGGQGSIKMGMLFPNVFSVVYALSPATLGITENLGIHGSAYRRINEITPEQVITGWDEFESNVIVAMGRAYSPNLNKPPYYADFPYEYIDGEIVVNHDVLEIWEQKSAIGMIDDHIENLKKLRALKLDWGRNEEHELIPVTCELFSKRLENNGIKHYAEVYIGDHGNMLWTDDGRAMQDMLPFFDTNLKFEE